MTLSPATDMYRGRGWARVGFWVGVSASVAANVAHAFLGGTPSPLLLLFAALPPFALLAGVEIIAQVRWRRVWYQWVIRWCAVGGIAAIGGIVSYDHMRVALAAHGEDATGSILLPLLVDGLMTVCSAALLTIGDNVRRAERAEADDTVSSGAGQLSWEDEPESEQPKPVKSRRRKVTLPRDPHRFSVPDLVANTCTLNPDATPAEIAAAIGKSERTVQRYMPKPVVVSASTEGGGMDELLSAADDVADRVATVMASVPA